MAGFLLEFQMINDEQSQPETELDNDGGMTEESAVAELLRQGAEANPDEQEGAEGDGQGAIEGEEAQPETPKRKLKVGDSELDEDEVVAGYMKDADYRRKTAEAAEIRRQAEQLQSYAQAEIQGRVQRMDAALMAMQRELIGDQQGLDELIRTDPAAYLARKYELDKKSAAFQQAFHERQAWDQHQQQLAHQQQQQDLARQRQVLAERLPAWKDPAKAQAEQREIADVLVSQYGYRPDELSELQDARALLLARDAMLYRKSLSLAKAKPAAAPAAVKAGAAPTTPGNERAEQDAMRRLKKTGRDEDAVAILLSRNKR